MSIPATSSSMSTRRYRCIDAVAALDVDELKTLVCTYWATTDDVSFAVAQTERDHDDLAVALHKWLATATISDRDRIRLVLTLTQPPLPLDLEF